MDIPRLLRLDLAALAFWEYTAFRGISLLCTSALVLFSVSSRRPFFSLLLSPTAMGVCHRTNRRLLVSSFHPRQRVYRRTHEYTTFGFLFSPTAVGVCHRTTRRPLCHRTSRRLLCHRTNRQLLVSSFRPRQWVCATARRTTFGFLSSPTTMGVSHRTNRRLLVSSFFPFLPHIVFVGVYDTTKRCTTLIGALLSLSWPAAYELAHTRRHGRWHLDALLPQ